MYQLSTDGEGSQVIEPATPGQQRNAAVVNSLFYLQTAMNKLLDTSIQGYSAELLQMIADSVQVQSTNITLHAGIKPAW